MNLPESQDVNDAVDQNGGDEPPNRVMLPTLETPTLTKAELAELLFERLGLNKRESKDMVEAFFDLIHTTLVSGDERLDHVLGLTLVQPKTLEQQFGQFGLGQR